MTSARTSLSTSERAAMARQQIQIILSIWEKEQDVYEHLYICLRNSGEKLKSLWIDKADSVAHTLFDTLGNKVLNQVTAIEAEYLFHPKQRRIVLNKNNQWNSLRGKRAAIISDEFGTTRWSSLEMIARNLSFSGIAHRHLEKLKQKSNGLEYVDVTLYKTKQYFLRVSLEEEQTPELVELFRGNQIVSIDFISKKNVDIAINAMVHWLSSQVDDKGKANYKYWPSRGEFASSNNAIRQWMATICLNRAGNFYKNEYLVQLAANNLAYNIETTLKTQDDLGYIWMRGSAKLGAAALAALSILESPNRPQLLKQEASLNNLINHLSNVDGSFDTFFIPRERKDNQNFYSGEALLYLAARYTLNRDPAELERFMAGFHYYRDWHLKNQNPAFIPWHTQAYYLVWKITKDNQLKDFIFFMNDWLLSMQQWDTAEYDDMKGRFYDPQRQYYGPPHASSTGVYLEGLIDAYELATLCQDSTRVENYRVAIIRGIRSIIQLQYKNEVDCYYVKKTHRVLGGVRTTVYNNTIRIDNVQHVLMALFKIYTRFSEEDFTVSV